MKSQALLISLLAALPAFAANFGTTSTEPPKTTTETPKPVTTPPTTSITSGPQLTGAFKIVKPDGSTVIQQGSMSVNSGGMTTLTIAGADAFVAGNGRCAFNVRYEETAGAAFTNTTNRIYSNDALIAQNTRIDLLANTPKSIQTQPYFFAGQNNIKMVLNADSSAPFTAWIRVNVTGNCGGVTALPAPPTTKAPETTKPPVVMPPKAPPPPVVFFAPGSGEWNNLFTAFGYSNFGKTQLNAKTYKRYADLVKLNADLTVVVNAKKVEQSAYNALMTRWNSFVADEAFKTAMKAIKVSSPGVK